MQLTLNQSYTYQQIEEIAEQQDYTIEEYGANEIGKNFIILEDVKHTYTFILEGASATIYMYKLIFIQKF